MKAEFLVAVHALVYLNKHPQLITSDRLSKSICTNPAFVRRVMSKLRQAELVATKEGIDGGYYLLRSAAAIDLRTVMKALDDSAVSLASQRSDVSSDCLMAQQMKQLMENLCQDLDDLCQQKLQGITIGSLSLSINEKETF